MFRVECLSQKLKIAGGLIIRKIKVTKTVYD